MKIFLLESMRDGRNCAFILYLMFLKISVIFSPPPNRKIQSESHIKNPKDGAKGETEATETEQQQRLYEFPYSQYLELVVKILEEQPKFQERIKGMTEDEIKSGKIADQIDDLGNEVFDKLTKAKLEEIDRLRKEIQDHIQKGGDASKIQMPEHIDASMWEKFTKEDLRKLIKKTVSDMDKLDQERKEKFKEYEMQKKAEQDHKLAQMSPEEREKAVKEIEESKKRHSEHEKIKHPGGRDQLEEVWEERDHMDKDNYDPKTFFALHDLNADGFWNEQEIEALFQAELEKVYNETNPDDDPKEKIEEMYRMREHVVKQMDKNEDRLISLDEFLKDAEAQDPQKKAGLGDEGWDDLANQKVYSDEELKKFEMEYAAQKGWGDHAYETVPAKIRLPEHLDTPPVQNQPQQRDLPQPEKFNIMDQNPQQPLDRQQLNNKPVGGVNPASVPEKAHKIDPVYGI